MVPVTRNHSGSKPHRQLTTGRLRGLPRFRRLWKVRMKVINLSLLEKKSVQLTPHGDGGEVGSVFEGVARCWQPSMQVNPCKPQLLPSFLCLCPFSPPPPLGWGKWSPRVLSWQKAFSTSGWLHSISFNTNTPNVKTWIIIVMIIIGWTGGANLQPTVFPPRMSLFYPAQGLWICMYTDTYVMYRYMYIHRKICG